MSVRYCTRFGYGFVVDSYELDELRKANKEQYNDFLDNDYAILIDDWGTEDSACFFGIIEKTLEPGRFYEVPQKRNYKSEDVVDMIVEFKKYFPTKAGVPQDYILSCIS